MEKITVISVKTEESEAFCPESGEKIVRKNILRKHLTNRCIVVIMIPAFGRLAQLVEHALDVRRVSGSSPLSSTKKTIHPDGLFYLVWY